MWKRALIAPVTDVDTTATVDIGAYETQAALANIPDTTTLEDTQVLVSFDGGDTSTITSVTANSSNPAVVPNDAAHLSPAINGSTGIVTISPATNASGTTNITGNDTSASQSFTITVNPVGGFMSFANCRGDHRELRFDYDHRATDGRHQPGGYGRLCDERR